MSLKLQRVGLTEPEPNLRVPPFARLVFFKGTWIRRLVAKGQGSCYRMILSGHHRGNPEEEEMEEEEEGGGGGLWPLLVQATTGES